MYLEPTCSYTHANKHNTTIHITNLPWHIHFLTYIRTKTHRQTKKNRKTIDRQTERQMLKLLSGSLSHSLLNIHCKTNVRKLRMVALGVQNVYFYFFSVLEINDIEQPDPLFHAATIQVSFTATRCHSCRIGRRWGGGQGKSGMWEGGVKSKKKSQA